MQAELAANSSTELKSDADLMTAPQNVLERPKQYMDSDRPINPVMITGFRPTWSDILLQCRTVMACVAKNMDCWEGDVSYEKHGSSPETGA